MKRTFALCIVLTLFFIALSAMAEPYTTEYGIKFGMTPEEVEKIETSNNNELKGTYEDADSYQLYYENDIHFYSLRCTRMEYDFDVIDRLLFQVYYVSKGGAADFAYAKSLLTAQYGDPVYDFADTGKYSLLYDQIGRNSHLDVVHWIIENENTSLGIDIWDNDYDTVFILFYDLDNPASYGAVPKYYSDATGISFSYIDGWDAAPISFPPLMIGFTLRGDAQSSIQYMQMDLWDSIKETFGILGYGREDIGPDFLEDDIVSALMQPSVPQKLRTETYNGLKFRVFEYQTDNNGKSSDLYWCTIAMTVKDGYLHMFQLSSVAKHDQLMPDFAKLLNSISFTK